MLNKLKSIALFILLPLLAATAFGQSNRVYVGESGSDANLCTTNAPCRTITHALTVVNAGGEVVVTENGEYDQFFVNKTVTVSGAPGITAKITTTGGYGVVIVGGQAADVVTIRNLNFQGPGAQVSSTGISNINAGTVNIDHCFFSGFSNAVNWGNMAGQLFVHETTVRNSLFGIGVTAPAEGLVRVTIDKCLLEMNDTGITLGSKVYATISNTTAVSNTSRAVYVRSTNANQRNDVTIDNCNFSNNTAGLLVGGTNGTSVVRLTRTTIADNLLAGVSIGAGHIVYSLQNNTITGNFPDIGGSLTPIALK